ncbi:helix-turn-helix domain-containing protein [Enterovibrio makurazakiensis]|uniref:Helix-turn-helix domain-containing protein n=1 Tax=Enterovibrio gelatinilyticus TaxID=2899819 RepID=A0ABT5R2H2_9GAMM|nr:helix-turn-helix domain-containing protein [Enterovibrio sp. ZSDZ42]MDD1794219.1 helix-turn-helix domain-containing protein [Enterovibrio sp. ZSDZ42]
MDQSGFSERLTSLLKQKKKTQAHVASAIGTSVPSVHRWTKGGQIEYKNLRSLAEYLDVNWIWLRYGDEAVESVQQMQVNDTAATNRRQEYLNQIMDSENRMRQALDMADIVTWEWNVLTGSVECSKNAATLFNVAENNLPNCMLPYTEKSIEELLNIFGKDEPHTWDFSVEGTNKSIFWFTSRAKLYFDVSGRPTKVIGVSFEIAKNGA